MCVCMYVRVSHSIRQNLFIIILRAKRAFLPISRLQCNTLQHTAIKFDTLQHIVAHSVYVTLAWGVSLRLPDARFETLMVSFSEERCNDDCNIPQHTATHCNTLQHTATYCNILQSTATYCNTLQNGPCCLF